MANKSGKAPSGTNVTSTDVTSTDVTSTDVTSMDVTSVADVTDESLAGIAPDTGVSSESVAGSDAQQLEAEANKVALEEAGIKVHTQKAGSATVEKSDKGDALKGKLAKLAGVKASEVIGFNEERQTIVTEYGGKYRLAPDGKSVITLAGPVPEEK